MPTAPGVPRPLGDGARRFQPRSTRFELGFEAVFRRYLKIMSDMIATTAARGVGNP